MTDAKLISHDSVTAACRVAFVGAGYMAREHIRAFADVPGVILSGIYSRTELKAASLAAEFGIARVCGSIDALFQQTQAQLVVVTVTELSMNAVSQECFRHPWTVLLEKPAGYNVADAEEIHRAATAAQRNVIVALNRRYYSSTRNVCERLAHNPEPRFIRLQDQEDQVRALQAGQPRLVVDNWMYANSIHVIDYLRIFGRGRISEVVPVVLWKPKAPGVVVSKIVFESGDVGVYEGVWNAPGPWSVSVTTPSERFELRPLEQSAVQRNGERKLESLDTHPCDRDFKPGLRLQAAHAVASALGCPADVVSLADALQTMYLVRDIYGLEN